MFVHTGPVRWFDGGPRFAEKPIFYLIGIVHGHYSKKVPIDTGDDIEALNTGIAIIVPIERIISFVNAIRPQFIFQS